MHSAKPLISRRVLLTNQVLLAIIGLTLLVAVGYSLVASYKRPAMVAEYCSNREFSAVELRLNPGVIDSEKQGYAKCVSEHGMTEEQANSQTVPSYLKWAPIDYTRTL